MGKFYFAIINGPNLNRLGKRERKYYGETPFEEILDELRSITGDNFDIQYAQSNSEGEIIDLLQQHYDNEYCTGIILNPGAYTHYSYAIADAVHDRNDYLPLVEVHISNIFSREDFRHKSVTGKYADGVISGLGTDSYRYALEYLIKEHTYFMESNGCDIFGRYKYSDEVQDVTRRNSPNEFDSCPDKYYDFSEEDSIVENQPAEDLPF